MWLNKASGAQDVDGELVCRMRQRDPEAMAELYDLYGRIVYMVIAREIRRPSIIEAILEETFLRAWNKTSELDPDSPAVGPWLMGIATHCATEYIRDSRASVPYLVYATFPNQPALSEPRESTRGVRVAPLVDSRGSESLDPR